MDQQQRPASSGTGRIQDKLREAFEARNYELIGELGRGGMGVVYLAQHRKLGRRVAIKTLSPDRQSKENSVARFQREARTFAQIRHPHIANLYEFEDSGAVQFLALEYIEGTDLEKERRKSRQWTYEEVGVMIASIADALAHTHKKGILHRDIKPGNILIERGTNRMVLTDFGLAKGEQDDTLTASGFAVGTPAYMAPEQITDQFNVKPDGRADIFSLGTVAYEMLLHKHPFIASDDLSTMRNIVGGKFSPVRECDPKCPAPLAELIEGMLARNPSDRIPDAAQVAARARAFLASMGSNNYLPAGMSTPSPFPPSALPNSQGHGSRPGSGSSSKTAPRLDVPSGSVSQQKLIIWLAVAAVIFLLVGIGIGVAMLKFFGA